MMDIPETRRPARVILLTLLVLTVAAVNTLRLGEAIFFWKTLSNYGAFPLYISMSAGVWLISGFILARGLWRGKAWGRSALVFGSAGYTFWYWLDRLFLHKNHSNGPLVLIVNLALLLIIFGVLFSKRTRLYLQREDHERQPKTSKPT